MGTVSGRRKWKIWIACCAILLQALAPSISHALNARHGKLPLIEICTTEGVKYVAFEGVQPQTSPADPHLHHLEHCPFCFVADASAPPLPSAASTLALMDAQFQPFPTLFYRAPAPLFVWSQAHPRAPPARM